MAKQTSLEWPKVISRTEYSKLEEETTPIVVVEMSLIDKNNETNYGTIDDHSKNETADQILRSSVEMPWYKKNIGLLYILLSALCISCLNITLKLISKSDERLPILELVFIRGCVGSVIVIIMMLKQGVANWFGAPDVVRLLLARGIFGFLALSFSFFAVSMLSIGDATILSFFSPIFAGLLASKFLKENWHAIDKVAAFFSMIGVIFIARPPFLFGSYSGSVDDSILMPDEASIPAIIVDSENSNEGLINSTTILNAVPNVSDNSVEAEFIRIAGVIMALLSAFCVAVVFVVIRKISKRADPLNVVFYYHWTLIPFALIFAPMVPTSMDSSSWMIPQKIETWALVFLGTFFGTASQFCMTKGLQTETAARASSMNYTQVIFAFTAEWILWGISPSPMTLFGAGIIIGSILSAEIYKNKVNK